jgi:hypothetical protein
MWSIAPTRSGTIGVEDNFMLLDHFHPPLFSQRHWSGFHGTWAAKLAIDLNDHLPDGWYAEPTVQWAIEVDVAAFEEAGALVGAAASGSPAGGWEPSAPAKTIDFSLTTDVVEVKVYRDFTDFPLVGVIELVSPANKDRPETREAFVSKCDAYLRDGIGLVMVDIVTNHRANLHSLLMDRLDDPEPHVADAASIRHVDDEPLYTSAYHPVKRNGETKLDIWYEPLAVGEDLLTMPLFLKNGPRVRVNLADTYRQTLRDLRYPQP